MRIVVFAAFYRPYKGGYVESVHELARRLVSRGHQVAVITCNTHNRPERELIDGVEVFRMTGWNPQWLNSSFTIFSPKRLMAAWRFFRNGRYDVVSTQTRFFPTTWLGLLFAKIGGLPLVHTERGSQHTVSNNPLIGWAGQLVDHTLGWLVCRLADRVVGVCAASCRFAAHLGAKKTMVVYNGVDCDFWRRESLVGEENNNGGFVIATVGRLVKAKGMQDLIRAVSLLDDKGVRVRIIGDGPYKNSLMELSKKLKISERIEFLGEMERERVREELSKADLFVNPSYSEGLPRTILEAAAVSLPIIASDVGGTGEIIIHQQSGILITAGSDLVGPLKRLLGNVGLRSRLAAAARQEVVSYFSWEPIVGNYEKIFMEAIHKH